MAIKAVFFDVGGTLVDETRMLAGWADWLRVDRMEFYAAVGAAIEAQIPYRQVFDMVAPHADMAAERQARAAAGDRFVIQPGDLYPDAAACIAACKTAGLVVGIAGNQPAEAEAALLACGLDAHHLATSAGWGVSKPDPKFFDLVAEACGLPPEQIVYVGDRVDNDVLPAKAAGMVPILLARGPWGVIQSRWPGAAEAAAVVRTLDGLAEMLAGLSS
jgi:HAD superfamily hydrolase (TIGR01509 family)